MNGLLKRTFQTATLRERRTPWAIIACSVSILLAGCGQEDPIKTQEAQDGPKGEPIAEVPVGGEEGVQYAHLDTPEMLPKGPSGVFSVEDGYAVPDVIGGKIVLLDANFGMKRTIDMRGIAQNVLAVAQDGDDLVALDDATVTPQLIRISPEGGTRSLELALSADGTPPTGVKADDEGLIVEYVGGSDLRRIVEQADASVELVPVQGYTWEGKVFSVDQEEDTTHHERIVRIGDKAGSVRVPNYLGAVQLIGPDGAGGAYVLVEDVEMTDMVSVEQSIWHFNADGDVASVSIVPMEERDVGVQTGVTLSALGKPIAMIPKLDSLQFWNLAERSPAFMLDRAPVEQIGEVEIGTLRSPLTTYNGSCLSSSQMQSNAQEYLNVSQYMSSNNINNNGSCTVRTKPNYLGSAGTYTSVSYDWGGWDTPSAFKSAISGGGKAGNTNWTQPGQSCSYGVDCSGFVTRVWGFTDDKRSTNTIPQSNTSKGPAYGPAYYVGDAFNLAGSHVVLYAGYASGGLNLWEAAGEPFARVVYRYSNWSYLSGYSSWRSLTSCN